MEYYVYVARNEAGKVVYVGSGKGNRLLHVTSGISHNKGLNAMFYSGDKVSVEIAEEGLSQQDALSREQHFIDTLSPSCNRVDAKKAVRSVSRIGTIQRLLLDCCAKTNTDDLGITSSDKLVLMTICAHVTDNIKCSISLDQLSKECGLSARTISKSVKTLREIKYVKVVASKYNNIYYVNANKIEEAHIVWLQKNNIDRMNLTIYTANSFKDTGFDIVEENTYDHKRNTSGLRKGNSHK